MNEVEGYIAALPPDRREAISAVRETILNHLPKGVEEVIGYGMIAYVIPLGLYPPGYHCGPKQPLPYLYFSSLKSHMAIYLFCTYFNEAAVRELHDDFAAAGKKLDMGKSCLRFKKLSDLDLPAIGRAVGRTTVDEFIAIYEAALPVSAKKKR